MRAAKQSHAMSSVLAALGAEKKLRPRPTPDAALEEVRAHLGGTAPEVATFFAFLTAHRLGSLGLWHIAKPKEMLAAPKAGASFSEPASIAAATGTMYIGKDGSGCRFFLLRARKGSEVFIHDPGAGQLSLLATSLGAFVELNMLIDQWDRFCDRNDVDADPEEVDEIDPSLPGFAELRARAKALKGVVDLGSGSDYDETVCALAKTTMRAKSASDVVAKYKAAKRAASRA
ncbi:MAG: hypothetical protein HOO96_23855 [Polyangiaceae bacterium]|nr:hypothetical protein [Polyangiaceae bacterium]